MSVLALLLLFGGAHEPMGEHRSTGHVVPLITSKPESCLSVQAQNGMFIVLDRADVTEMAKPRPAQWTTEAERMLRVRSTQARALLANSTNTRDALGCEVVGELAKGKHALLEILNRGDARVWDATSRSFLPAIERLDDDPRCDDGLFGGYRFRRPDGEVFMAIQTCRFEPWA